VSLKHTKRCIVCLKLRGREGGSAVHIESARCEYGDYTDLYKPNTRFSPTKIMKPAQYSQKEKTFELIFLDA
jgi:hypothetical protein